MYTTLAASIRDELAQAITTTRNNGQHAGKIARKILHNDAAGTLLVGITHEGLMVCYDRSMWSVTKTPINDDGGFTDGA